MAITLGSTAATQGVDFSTTVSGAVGTPSLVNGADGVFSFDGTKLTARGDRLTPGTLKVAFDDFTMTNGVPAHTAVAFDITVARASAAAPVSITVPPTVAGASVLVAPAGTNLPSGTVFQLLDARGNNPIDPTKLGLTFDKTTGALTGTLAAGAGLFDVVVVGMKGVTEVARSRRFSAYNDPKYSPILAPVGGGITPPVVVQPTTPLTGLLIGSSTPAKYPTDGTGPSNSLVTKSSDGINWTPVGTTGAGLTNLGDQLQKRTGRPVRFLTFGLAGTQADEWNADTFAQRTAAINAVIAAGGVDFIISGVGFNDAYQADGVVTSQASHQAKLESIFNRIRTGINQPSVPVFIMGSQKYTGTATSKPDDMYTWVRGGEIGAANSAPNYWYGHSYDLAQTDGIHLTNAAYIPHATRGAENILRYLNGQAVERGPTVIGLTAIYNTRTDMKLSHSSGNDFTPTSAITGFELSFDNFATIAAVSSVARQSGDTVSFIHAASGGAVPATRAIHGAKPITTAALHDNSMLALPINPTLAPIFASAGSNVVDPNTGTPTPTPTPTPTSSFTDEFNYTNGSTLAANGWTSPSGTMTVQDGEVYGSVIGNSIAPYTPVSGNQGATVPIRQKTIGTGNSLVLLHYQDESNYVWGGFVGTDRWQIGKTLAGTAGQIATGTVPTTAAGATNVVDFAAVMASDGLSMALTLTIDGAVIYSGITVSDTALLPKGQMGLRQSAAAATATIKTAFTRFAGRSS